MSIYYQALTVRFKHRNKYWSTFLSYLSVTFTSVELHYRSDHFKNDRQNRRVIKTVIDLFISKVSFYEYWSCFIRINET